MNIDNFLFTLPIMGIGMLGIFIVTGIIILTIAILNKVTKEKQNDKKEEK